MKARLVIISILSCISFSSYGQEDVFKSFAGISTDFTLIRGSMNGISFFQTDDEIILVPKVNPGIGFGLSYGFRFNDFTFDFAYCRTTQNYFTEVEGYAGRSSANIIRYLGFKKFISPHDNKIIEPYYDIDLSVVFFHFEKVSHGIHSNVTFNSANYSGVNFGFGFGTLVNLSKKLSLNICILPEYYMGTDIRAKNSERYEITKFPNFFLNGKFGLLYYMK